MREMTVLGHVVENPNTNTDGRWLGSIFFLPSEVYKELTGNAYVMSYAFNIGDDQEADMETFLKHYTDSVEPTMNYKSKFTAVASLKGIQDTAVLIGGALALIIGLIGVLNLYQRYFDQYPDPSQRICYATKHRHTRKQLVTMLCFEGSYYAALTAVSSVVLSIAGSLLIVRPLCGQIWFTSYHFVFWPLLIVLPLLFVLGILVPLLAYHTTEKQSIAL
ncbi:ABC transporter permease family protein [Desulfosporosinus shakirovi]|uniref:hypothetical protein n=1 Tax=Desulfosporosinus shakirovi TaxID=2885154 RepID=UPI001E2FFA5C|nr:hypothetical protein [Desulfosporosinus sp. SRJS8]MCB8817875.1 hypothetical protein [Desulfosporosinus sp. SRJS8]